MNGCLELRGKCGKMRGVNPLFKRETDILEQMTVSLTITTKGTRAMADIDSTPKKQCRKCGVEKLATRDNFYKAKKGKYGLHAWCKPCMAEYDHARWQDPVIRERKEVVRETPERIAKRREYDQRPEVKLRKSQRDNTPEKLKRLRERSRITPPEKRIGSVYLLRAENGIYKIGRGCDVLRRIRGIQTLSPIPITTVCIIESFDSFEMECQLHTRFKSQRLHGEWFALTPEDVEYIKGLAE